MRAQRRTRKDERAAGKLAPMTEILVRVAQELRHAAVQIEHTPIWTQHVREGMGSTDADYMRAIQGLDHSSQSLAGLADFLAALADRAPAHWLIDSVEASKVVALAELASRLSLKLASGESETPGASSGDCEFF
jgi:hypothetical protein